MTDLPLTLPAVLAGQVRERGDKVFFVCDGESLTYGELDRRSRRLARGLIAAGAQKGSHIALLSPPNADFVAATLAVARIGAVLIPLSTMSTAEELRGLLAGSDTSFLITARQFRSQDYAQLLKAALPELDYSRPPPLRSLAAPHLRRIWFMGGAPQGEDAGWSLAALEAMAEEVDEPWLAAVEARVVPADRFVILHTSGSTGKPKGVIHQHGTALKHLHNINAARDLTADDVYFTTFAWFWTAGFMYGLIGVLAAGGRIVWSNSPAPADMLALLERERVSFTNGFWRTVSRWAADPTFPDRDLSALRHGNLWPIQPADRRPKDPALRHDIYGMSETGPALTLGPDTIDLPESMRGSCGGFMPEFEVKIVDPETLETLAAGQAGELWVRGHLMSEGYYGKPRSAVYSVDGWYRTGDIGVIDEQGCWYLQGRIGDMIKTSAANVSPREVEAVLGAALGDTPCIVLGVPDEERGQAVAAVVVTDAGVDEAALKERLRQSLSVYKVPRRIIALAPAEIPLLANGKYDMPKLTALVQARLG
jgi:acyl-CoA synthetase (AMP-forming)/AMP-acid ligase II